ncbi:hypothetical protein WICPIJ_003199 [Wickerhamomyces pijperi]|uniref:NAD(+) diphosphatase n=1 Tax=Wickerhamomyces pijperi TaxID=599730 RepID=A0A9P8QAB0_WICPI|nr:hypothetical protein WICPIJ_003199 [Wickerhamomyces pijperi]
MERLRQIQGHLTSSSSKMSDNQTTSINPQTKQTSDESLYLTGSPLNRLSFLRGDTEFIQLASTHSSAKFIIFDRDLTLISTDKSDKTISLYKASYEQLKSVVDQWASYNNTKGQDLRINDVRITFLGVQESDDPSVFQYKRYQGSPYFAIDLCNESNLLQDIISTSSQELSLIKDRKQLFHLSHFDVSLFSHSKMYLDWLQRTKFCSGCGSQVIAYEAGTKLLCSSTNVHSETGKFQCIVKSASVSNASFPRTDPVIITAITTPSYSKVLLARGRRFPVPMYSCVAGFMEPSETIEEASRREVWEETGIRIGNGEEETVEVVKSQPWPYPVNLMVGCLAFVREDDEQRIDLTHDAELLDAKWVNTRVLKEMVHGAKADSDWFLPPKEAIAHWLIKEVINRFDKLSQ